MKTIYLILIFITFNIASAQLTSGNIKYKVKVAETPEIPIDKMMLSINKNFYSIIKEFEFELKFSSKLSSFSKIEKLYSDDEAAKMGSVKIGFLGNYYTSNDTVYKYGTSRAIGDYIVHHKINKKWIITTESKTIDRYLCYKALTEKVVTTAAGTFVHPIIAWFCPEMPYAHGPLGYGGLPGVILELQTKDAVFGATEIFLSNKIIKINKFQNAKLYSEADLDLLFMKKNSSR
ncbi:MAG: hypothetical protein RLZZ312_770 [Bacteroidota bacterium]|jgi:GLPGLI family protein